MIMRGKDLTGYKIGMLSVMKFSHRIKRNDGEGYRKYWLCKCDCGKTTIITQDSLVKKQPQQTCGFLRNKKAVQRFKEYNCKIKKNPNLIKYKTLQSNGKKNRNEFIKRRDGWQCRLCKWPFNKILLWNPYFKKYPPHNFRLEVHHIDSDIENNNSNNLITLCVLCHRKIQGKDKYISVMNLLNMKTSRKPHFDNWQEELFYMRRGIWSEIPVDLQFSDKIGIAI